MKVTYFLRDNGACGYYRADLPMNHMASPEIKVAKFEVGGNLKDLEKAIMETNVMLIPRLSEDRFISLAEGLQKDLGVKIVVDHDDNMFEVSPLSPHYADCGTQEVRFKQPDGSILDVWIDGENGFDIKRNQKLIDGFENALSIADMVTVTTPVLAEVYKPYAKKVVALPNCIDVNKWQRLPLKPHEGVRIGWFGGHSHYQDWLVLQDVMPKIIKKYSHVKFVIMGSLFKGAMGQIPAERIEFHEWVATPAYPYKAAILDLDFAIIPLEDNKFNRCKSNIKWVEMGALCVPAVTSHVSPYKEAATEDNGIFIENNDPKAWENGISMLIEDAALREKMGVAANKTVNDQFDINKKFSLWEDAYKGLLN